MKLAVAKEIQNVDFVGSGVVGSLIWRFVRATKSQLKRIKREKEERIKRHEPVYNRKYFKLVQTQIKRVTQTWFRPGLFNFVIGSVHRREVSIKRVFKKRQQLAKLNTLERQKKQLKGFWEYNRELLSFCRNITQYIGGVNKDIKYNKLSRVVNRQMNTDVGFIQHQRNFNRSDLLAKVSKVTLFGYKWIMGSEAFFHGRAARLLYTLRERKNILIKHFQVAHVIWRKLPSWMSVLGRRRQLYGLSRVLRVNPFDQRDGFRLLISSVYNNFKTLSKVTRILQEDKNGVLHSVRFLRSSRLGSGSLKLSLRNSRTLKNRIIPINIVLISKRSNFYIIFGEQRGKMLIAISTGCIGFVKKRNRQRPSAGVKLASLGKKVLKFLKRKYKRLKVKIIIHDSVRRNKTARTILWNMQHDLVDRSFKRFRHLRRMYYGKWFRNLLIETGDQLGQFDRARQEAFIDGYIDKLSKRGRCRAKWVRKLVRSTILSSIGAMIDRSDFMLGTEIVPTTGRAMNHQQIGTRLKWALQDNIGGNWRNQIVKVAKTWYVKTSIRPQLAFVKKFIWRSESAEREYQRQHGRHLKTRYTRVVGSKGGRKIVKRNKYRKNVSSKK